MSSCACYRVRIHPLKATTSGECDRYGHQYIPFLPRLCRGVRDWVKGGESEVKDREEGYGGIVDKQDEAVLVAQPYLGVPTLCITKSTSLQPGITVLEMLYVLGLKLPRNPICGVSAKKGFVGPAINVKNASNPGFLMWLHQLFL